MNKDFAIEFLVTVIAVIVGLVAGKLASKGLSSFGVPIAAGNPLPVPLMITPPGNSSQMPVTK